MVDAEEFLAVLALEVGGHRAVVLVTKSLLCIPISAANNRWQASELELFIDELPELVEDAGEAATKDMYLLLDAQHFEGAAAPELLVAEQNRPGHLLHDAEAKDLVHHPRKRLSTVQVILGFDADLYGQEMQQKILFPAS